MPPKQPTVPAIKVMTGACCRSARIDEITSATAAIPDWLPAGALRPSRATGLPPLLSVPENPSWREIKGCSHLGTGNLADAAALEGSFKSDGHRGYTADLALDDNATIIRIVERCLASAARETPFVERTDQLLPGSLVKQALGPCFVRQAR